MDNEQLGLADGCYTLHDFFYNNILEVDEAIDTALDLMFAQINDAKLHGHFVMPNHLGGDKFYFRVNNAKKGLKVKFNMLNMIKNKSLYNDGMKVLMYSVKK